MSKEPKEEWATAAPSSAALQAVKAGLEGLGKGWVENHGNG